MSNEPPDKRSVGKVDVWTLPLDGGSISFRGTYLGCRTSQRSNHTHDGEAPKPGQQCSACRWMEARLFRADAIHQSAFGRYVLHKTGASVLSGETPRYSHQQADSPYEVIELLTVVRTVGGEQRRFVGTLGRRLLAQAAYYDDDMRDAFEGRFQQL